MDYVRKAGKDPNVIAVNRLMVRGKQIIAKYLTDSTGVEWEPGSSFEESYRPAVKIRFFPKRNPAEETPMRFYVGVEIAWDTREQSYFTTAEVHKASRTIAYERKSGFSLDDLRRVTNFVTPDLVAKLVAAMKGSYRAEYKEIEDLLNKAFGQALSMREDIAGLEALARSPAAVAQLVTAGEGELEQVIDSLFNLASEVDSKAGYIRNYAQSVRTLLKHIADGT